ncbi:hypothetical protein DFH29DRAFT_995006 [Suillus ampliporus]|nr:hypothetical protein DFH29DRAFT_995006 [Suillus ampliporus]
MATKSEVFGDSESVPNAPLAYDAISTSAASAESVQCTSRPSIFSFLWIKRTTRANVLSRVRNIVCAPDFSPSSVAQNVNDCAASLSAAEFSNLLQKRNIEDHTALYWAIVNKRREAFSALAGFISKYSSVCSSDLRLACMATSDHALFTSLNLGDNINPKDESLRRLLGCPPDEVQVHDEGDGLRKIQFVTRLRIRMFQKRLRTTQELGVEFVARGVWSLSKLFLTLT